MYILKYNIYYLDEVFFIYLFYLEIYLKICIKFYEGMNELFY